MINQRILFFETLSRQKKKPNNIKNEIIDEHPVEIDQTDYLREISDNMDAEHLIVNKTNLLTRQFQDLLNISNEHNIKPSTIKQAQKNLIFQNPTEVHQGEHLCETDENSTTKEKNTQLIGPQNYMKTLEELEKNSNDNRAQKEVIAEMDRSEDLCEISEDIANLRVNKTTFERLVKNFIIMQKKNSDDVEQTDNKIVPGSPDQTEDYNDISENVDTEWRETTNVFEKPMEIDQTGDLVELSENINNYRVDIINSQGQLTSHLESSVKTLEKQKVSPKKTEIEQTEELSDISEDLPSNGTNLQRQLTMHIEHYNRTLERLKKNTPNDNRTMDKVVDENCREVVEIEDMSETESLNMEKPYKTKRTRRINQLITNDDFIETQYKFNTKTNDDKNKNDELINQLRPRRPNQPITTTLDAKTKREHFKLSRTSGTYSYQTTSISDVLDIYTHFSGFDDYISITNNIDDDQSTKTARIIRELIDTEESYSEALKQALLYKQYLDEYLPYNVKKSVIKDIFCNIEEIFERSQKFLQILKRRNDISNVNSAFIKCESMLDLYVDYVRNKATSDATYDKYKPLIKKKQEKLQDIMGLASHLQTPVQRLGRYILLLEHIEKDLIKRKQTQDATYVRSNIDKIKRVMRKLNDYLMIDMIKKCPEDLNLTAQGSFILRETFVLHKPLPLPEVVACLFENVVVFTSPDKHSQHFLYMKHIFLQELKLNYCVESPVTFGLEKFTRDKRIDATASQFVLEASNEGIKKRWIEIVEKILWEQFKQAKAESLMRTSVMLYSDEAVEYIQNCKPLNQVIEDSNYKLMSLKSISLDE